MGRTVPIVGLTVAALVSLACAFACSGSVRTADDTMAATDAQVDHGSRADGSKDAAQDTSRRDARSDSDALAEYHDDPCPDVSPIIDKQCDPLNPSNGDCAPGMGCYPYVNYPRQACEPETYGAMCMVAGRGGQYSACDGPMSCAPGFVCVITGAGDVCIRLCPLDKRQWCPDGMVCEAIDVLGYGGCI